MNGSGQNGQNFNNYQAHPFGGITQPTPTPVAAPVPNLTPNPMQPQVGGQAPNGNATSADQKDDHSSLIKTIILIFVSILAVTFFGLFIFMYFQWNSANLDVEGRIDEAVATAEYNLKTELESQFEEKEKYPFKTFTGPSDFGALTFEYPKTWSIYVSDDASRAQDYHAYFNPGQVNVVNNDTVMALRVSITNQLTDEVKKNYKYKIDDGKLKVTQKVINNANVDIYTGELDSGLQGIFALVKIRDKTAIIQTDAMIFEKDFYTLLETVKFNV
jgi:hypothetical protein